MRNIIKWMLYVLLTVMFANAQAGCVAERGGACPAPTIRFLSPTNGSAHPSGTPLTVSLDASDSGDVELIYEIVLTVDGVVFDSRRYVPQLNNASATFSVPSLSVGPHTLRATVYDQRYRNSSATVGITVSEAARPTITTLTSGPAPVPGGSVWWTATVAGNPSNGSVPTGNLSFAGENVALVNGQASWQSHYLLAGENKMTATYGGSASYLGSSASAKIVVAQRVTSTNLSTSVASANARVPVTLSAAVSNIYIHNGSSVTFYDGAASLGSVPLNPDGSAVLQTSFAAAGTHNIVAVFSGNRDNAPSTSGTVAVTTTSPTEIYGSVSPGTPTVNAPAQLEAIVTGTSPSGSVSFSKGGVPLGTGMLVNGRATLGTTFSQPGSHTIAMNYIGDSLNLRAPEARITFTVAHAATAITAGASPVTPSVNQQTRITATVSGSAPAGSVRFSEEGATLGFGTIAGGSASIDYAFVTAGLHRVTVSYGGDTNNSPSADIELTINVAQAAPSITAIVAPSSPIVSQAARLTAYVGGYLPTGQVEFRDGGVVIGYGAVSSGAAVFDTIFSTAGPHAITASYGGDYNNKPSGGFQFNVAVAKAAAAMSGYASPANPVVNQGTRITATVTGSNPTGDIVFKDGETVLGSRPLAGGSAFLDAAFSSAGSRTVTMSYGGDANNSASSNINVGITVAKVATSVITSASPATPAVNQVTRITATTSGSSPTGRMYFYEGGVALGSAAMTNGVAYFDRTFVTAGPHTMVAAYEGDQNNLESPTRALLIEVTRGATTVATGANPSAPAVGQSTVLTASIAGASPSGRVYFKEGETVLGTATLSGGSASATTTFLSAGNHTIAVSYEGDANNLTSNASFSLQVAPAATSISGAANPATPRAGQATRLTATVNGSSPTGKLVFKAGTVTLGEPVMTAGSAYLDTSFATAGTHPITVSYAGDANNKASADIQISVQVARATTAIAASANPAAPRVNQATRMSATVSGSVPTGLVSFLDQGVSIGSATLQGGSVFVDKTFATAGNRTVTVSYPGDDNNAAASFPLSIQVAPAVTGITASTTPSTPKINQSTRFTVTVSGSSPTGTVHLKKGGVTLDQKQLMAGSAFIDTSFATVGAHTITVSYDGDANNSAVAATPFNIVVGKATSAVALGASPAAPIINTSVRINGTVSGATPGGVLTFSDGTRTLGAPQLSSGAAAVDATFATAGTYTLTASYSGDALNEASSSQFQLVVGLPAGAVSITVAPLTVKVAEPVTLSAVVGGNSPTGSVIFKDNGADIGSAVLNSGKATLTKTFTAAGTRQITASYQGDAANGAATSAPQSLTVKPAPGNTPTLTTVTANAKTGNAGASFVFSAAVSGASPTGVMLFKNGTVTIATVAVGSGQAAFSTSALPVGAHSITATYDGDEVNAVSVSAPVVVMVRSAVEEITLPELSTVDAGSLPGTATVGGGKANYSLPLSLPPGVAGMVPAVSLNYDGGTANGLMGVGWTISSYSAIHRCGPTIANDGRGDTIRLTNSDRLCLDGKRLHVTTNTAIGVDANTWAAAAQFRTENESFTKVVRTNDGFTAYSRDGRIHYYGGTALTQRKAPVGTLDVAHTWTLRKVEDRPGNAIDYIYSATPATGEYVLKQIRWGANSRNAQSAFARVDFKYESRTDIEASFVAGGRADIRERLAEVTAWTDTEADGTGGTMATNYKVAYEQSASSGRSLVKSIQACSKDDGCIPATTFTWGAPAAAATRAFKSLGVWNGPVLEDSTFDAATVQNDPRLGHTPDDMYIVGDFTGDGLNDIMTRFNDNTGIHLYRNTGTGFLRGVDSQMPSVMPAGLGPKYAIVETGDFDGDGKIDLLIGEGSVDSAGFTRIRNSPLTNMMICYLRGAQYLCNLWLEGSANNSLRLVHDFDGDGRSDIYISAGNPRFGNTGPQRLCLGASMGFNCSPVATADLLQLGSGDPSNSMRFNTLTSDLEGDGRLDLLQLGEDRYDSETRQYYFHNPGIYSKTYNYVKNADGSAKVVESGSLLYDYGPAGTPNRSATAQAGDLNGDGYTDMLIRRGTDAPEFLRCLASGSKPMLCDSLQFTYNGTYGLEGIVDYEGDGQNKAVISVPGELDKETWKSCVTLTGGALSCNAPWTVKIAPQTPDEFRRVDGEGVQVLSIDLTGNGVPEVVYYSPGGKWEVLSAPTLAATDEALDRLLVVTNGVGHQNKFEYGTAGDTTVYNPVSADHSTGAAIGYSYPLQAIPRMGSLVKSFKVGNGQGGWLETRYSYSGAARDLTGRGHLGFARIDVTEVNGGTGSDLVSTTWYRQDAPFIGMVQASRKGVVGTNGVELNKTVMTLASQSFKHASGLETLFSYVKSETSTNKDLSGDAINTVTKDWTYGDLWGNATIVNEKITSGGVSVTTATNTVYTNSPSTWLFGLPGKIQVVKDREGVKVTRLTYATFDSLGLPASTTVEPNNIDLRSTVMFNRTGNMYGNVKGTTQTYREPQSQVNYVRTLSDVKAFDARGRFATTVANDRGHTTERTYDPRNGAVTSVTENGQTTTYTVDAFGRVVKQLNADGTEQRFQSKQCLTSCPSNAVQAQVSEGYVGTTRSAAPAVKYLDSTGKPVRTQTWGRDGRAVLVDVAYDARGRLTDTNQPRFGSDSNVLASRLKYDDLSRATSSAVADEQGVLQETTTTYAGLTTTITDPLKNSITSTRDGTGLQLTSTAKFMSGTASSEILTTYSYEPFGNLASVKDDKGNLVSIGYDVLGRRLSLNDPDLGLTSYAVDPVGRVWRQQSARQLALSQYTYTEYDGLDRMTKRTESDLISTWIYDTAANGIGKLAETYTGTASVKDYKRVHTYDTKGRPSSTTIAFNNGSSFTSQYGYDSLGRVESESHQRDATAAKVYTRVYGAAGYLERIERAGAPLWQASASDAAGQVTYAGLGNGLTIHRTFNGNSGRVTANALELPGGAGARLLEGVLYDERGNVKERNQYWNGIGYTETFKYDGLNRLSSAQVGTAAQNFYYDSIGNLTGKTGTGNGASTSYIYPAAGTARPHAVQSITGIDGAYGYDANGNLTSGPGGTTITWKSFDMPDTITRGGKNSQFAYGPEHQRARQTRSDGATVHYADSMEVEVLAGGTTVKTYWPDGIGLEIDAPGKSTQLLWTHTDKLGNVVGTSDAQGNLLAMMAYDAWGKRRTLDGTATPDTLDWTVDNKGFTGHEMLDNVDMVHMNGRIYDPFIARFISADPIIQDPQHSQSYNRYSYVWNNPTNMTDPTGFQAHGDKPQPTMYNKPCIWANGCTKLLPVADNGAGKAGGGKPGASGKTATLEKPKDGSANRGGGGAAERFVEQHRSDVQNGNGGVYEPLQPLAVAGTSAMLGGSGIAALATTSAGRALLAFLGFGLEMQSMADGVPGGRGIATAPVEKFSGYIFKEGADHGKDAVFRSLGYNGSHSAQLAKTWETQAAEKFSRGEYALKGSPDKYGQRIDIGIELKGVGSAAGKTSHIKSGWMLLDNGTIRLNTPFSGFTK